MFGFLVFASIAITMVLVVGLLMGAQFETTGIAILESVGYFLLVVLASSGIGLIIGTVIRRGESAVFTGIGTTMITSFTTGTFLIYSNLPSYLQDFSRIYPVSSSNYGILALLIGEEWAGYNPLQTGQILLTIALSITLFVVGSVLHSRYGWRRD
jgi:ABC-2 type transport system permease protein